MSSFFPVHNSNNSIPEGKFFSLLLEKDKTTVLKNVHTTFKNKSLLTKSHISSAVKYAINSVHSQSLDALVIEFGNLLNKEAMRFIYNSEESKYSTCKAFLCWKKRACTVRILSQGWELGASYIGKGSIIPLGLSILYLRSHKILALANVCAACALQILSSEFLKISKAFSQQFKTLNELKVDEVDEVDDFLQSVSKSYEDLKKESWIARSYLNAHKKHMKGKQSLNSLVILKEHIDAFNHLSCFLKKFFFQFHSFQSNKSTLNLEIIKNFFKKFEKLCLSAQKRAIGIWALSLVWSYYAYTQRAYLMVLAGIVHLIAWSVIIKELFTLAKGSKKIYSFDSTPVINSNFQAMAAKSWLFMTLPNNMEVEDIQQHIVTPMNFILTLIPTWKEEIT